MEERAIAILKFSAWILLVVCLVTAVTTWFPGSASSFVTGVILTVAGVAGWAFFTVVGLIAESLIEIRANTTPPAKSRLFDPDIR